MCVLEEDVDGPIYDGEGEINYNSIWILRWSTREEDRVRECGNQNGPVRPRRPQELSLPPSQEVFNFNFLSHVEGTLSNWEKEFG